MNFTPSSSISSSSSSFSENYCTNKGNAFGCFAGVLSRILCSKSLPSHPSNPIELDSNSNYSKTEDKILDDGLTTPNVVANLMGLDSMPELHSSKSMDTEHYREETKETQGTTRNRRVKISLSFSETPESYELKDDDFLVLCFENSSKIKKKGSNYGNFEVGSKGHKHRKRRDQCRIKQRRNRDEHRVIFSNEERSSLKISPANKIDTFFGFSKESYHLSPWKDEISGKKEALDGNKVRKKKRNKYCLGESKDEVEFDSENSSPVSVLDHNTDFINDLEVTSEEDARLRVSEGVSKDCASQTQTTQSSQIHKTEKEGNKERKVVLKRRNNKNYENAEMLKKICKLVEEDVKDSNWMYRRMLGGDELDDTAKDFGQRIFDQLISELLDQLVGF